jgi:ABC-type dipeptide/oligopeptide/nickel transport system permease subunit
VDPIQATHVEGITAPAIGGAGIGEGGAAGTDFEVSLESLNQRQLAWRQFKKNRLAVIGSAIFLFMVAVAILGPVILPYDRLDITGVKKPGGNPPSLESIKTIFGTDSLGRSVLVLTANGARLSMLIGVMTTIIAVTIGVTVGGVAGFFGGWADGLLMRLVDLVLAVPFLFIVLVAARFFGGGDPIIIILIFGLLAWPGLARLVRAMFLSLREQDFVHAARAVGVSNSRIIFKHMLPNAIGPIVVSASLLVAGTIVLEAFVSFLNFGVRATDVSWGNALSNSQGTLVQGNWWWAFFPGMAIALTVIAINFMGDGLRDALDPYSRGR